METPPKLSHSSSHDLAEGWNKRLLSETYQSTDREQIEQALALIEENRSRLTEMQYRYAKEVLTVRLKRLQ